MAARIDEDTKLLELLNRHPELKQRVRALADIAEDADGDLVRADEAERRVIEEVRRIGQETLRSWAEARIARGEAEQLQADGVRGAGKKTLLAHHVRNHCGRGTAVSFGHAHQPSLLGAGAGRQPLLLAALATGGYRLWC
ncbi:MAG: hypothetical protein WBG92_23690 [Thiohalocapsa sp.]